MVGEKLQQAKLAIKDFLTDFEPKNPGSTVYFSTFDNDTSPKQPLTLSNFDSVVGNLTIIDPANKHTDLHRTLYNKIDEMNATVDSTQRKVIILLTDGKDDTYSIQNYQGARISKEQVYEKARGCDKEFAIYTIGVGNQGIKGDLEEDFLKQIPASTPYATDTYNYAKFAGELKGIFKAISRKISSNIEIQVYPGKGYREYDGIQRDLNLRITYEGNTYVDIKKYGAGAYNNQIEIERANANLVPNEDTTAKEKNQQQITAAAWGVALLLGILLLLILLLPGLKKLYFQGKFIHRYGDIKKDKIRKTCPIIKSPIKDDTIVVDKCLTMVSLKGWKHLGGSCGVPKCPTCGGPKKNHKDTTDHKRKNLLQQGTAELLQQEGVNKRLAWLWFGALGGFIGWGFYVLAARLGLESWHKTMVVQALVKDSQVDTFNIAVISGIFLSAGLSIGLLWVENLKRATPAPWGRVLLKILLAFVASWGIFMLVTYAYLHYFNFNYIGGFISWLMFSIALGFILTLDSGIPRRNGLIAGFLASIFAYHIYYGLIELIPNPLMGQMMGYIFLGTLLGLVMVWVINSLEEFYLEVAIPAKKRGTYIRLSKWLMQNQILILGRKRKIPDGYQDTLYTMETILWDSKIEDHHVAFRYNRNEAKVFVKPLPNTRGGSHFVEVNGRNISKEAALKDKDLIKIGNTTLEYRERRKQPAKDDPPVLLGPEAAPDVIVPREGAVANPKIKINRVRKK